MPVQKIDAAFGTGFDTEPDPSQIVGRHEVIAVLADEAGAIGFHDVGQHGVFVNVAHEQSIAILLRKRIGQIESRTAVSGQVRVITDRLDVVIDVRIDVRLDSVCGRRRPERHETGAGSRSMWRSPGRGR